MIAELTRKTDFVCSLSSVEPFIWVGFSERHVFIEEWGTTLGDVLQQTGKRNKIVLVLCNFVNEYSMANSYNDMKSQPGSFYFDRVNEQIYIHTELNDSPLVSIFNYGYSFGMTDTTVIYIGDYVYQPLLKSIPDIEQSADTVGLDKPTGMTGSAVLENLSVYDKETEKYIGLLDFLIDENIYGNDFRVYDKNNNPVGVFKIENITIGMSEVSLDLQDKRIE